MMAPLLGRAELAAWAERLRAAGRRIVFTNGCFDLIHRGHAEYLAEAAACGDALLVAVNSDASVRDLKGPGRPLVPEADRCAVLQYLRPVAAVTIFDEPTPLETITLVRPDVLVKGDEYAEDGIVGASEVRAWGGDVVRAPMRSGRSTSGLIASIKRLP
ncbi:adenylyltransferase/cytidyltransferase family protein [bacterium]|nr:adenylyltransferase/cytidyltransferase family protein [bacterium]